VGSRLKKGRQKSQLPKNGRKIFSIPQIKFYHYSTVVMFVSASLPLMCLKFFILLTEKFYQSESAKEDAKPVELTSFMYRTPFTVFETHSILSIVADVSANKIPGSEQIA
jgi:hypothetical protein